MATILTLAFDIGNGPPPEASCERSTPRRRQKRAFVTPLQVKRRSLCNHAFDKAVWGAEGLGVSSIYYLAAGGVKALRFVGHFEELLKSDHVVAHDMITVPHLTSLPNLAERLPVAINLSVAASIWPTMPQDPERDLSWMAEPIIERITDPLRDRVAAIHQDQLPAIIQDWNAELNGAVDESQSRQLAADLVLLAERGRDRQLHLYNWYEL